MGRARRLTRFKDKLCRSFRMLFPELLDLLVGFAPLPERSAPITEYRRDLRRAALLARNPQDLADPSRQRVCNGIGSRRHAKSEPAQVVVLVVVAIPATMILPQFKAQNDPARE